MQVLDAFLRTGTPEARLKAERFEGFVVGVVLPFFAGHVYLVAMLGQYHGHPEMARACALIATAVGCLLFAINSTGVLAAVGASSLAAGALFVLPPWATSMAIAIIILGFVHAVTRDRIEGSGAALFFLHVPILNVVTTSTPGGAGAVFTMLSLLVAAAVLIALRRVTFAGAALTGGLLAALGKGGLVEAPIYAAAGLAALLAVGAMLYEIRRKRRAQSALRRALAQSLAVFALFLFASLVTDEHWSGAPYLCWFVLVLLVQVVQMAVEPSGDVIRPMWPTIALVAFFWGAGGLGDWRRRAALTCAVIAALHGYALWRRSRFVAVIAAGLTIVPAAIAFNQIERGIFDPGSLMVQVLITLTLLAQGVDPGSWQPEYRWWRGFIPRRHWRTLTAISSMAAKALENAAVVGILVKASRAAVGWVRYLTGGAPIRLQDVVYAAAHVYGAWMASGQVMAIALASGVPSAAATLASQLSWIGWALAVLMYGAWAGDVLSRYVGLVLACVPAATGLSVQRESDGLWLLAATGAALTAYAAVRMRQAVSDAPYAPQSVHSSRTVGSASSAAREESKSSLLGTKTPS